MNDYIKLTNESIPTPETLVWCKRKNGKVYLATRQNKQLAPDGSKPWDNCHWYGFAECGGVYSTNGRDMEHQTNFSDVTVDSWKYVERP